MSELKLEVGKVYRYKSDYLYSKFRVIFFDARNNLYIIQNINNPLDIQTRHENGSFSGKAGGDEDLISEHTETLKPEDLVPGELYNHPEYEACNPFIFITNKNKFGFERHFNLLFLDNTGNEHCFAVGVMRVITKHIPKPAVQIKTFYEFVAYNPKDKPNYNCSGDELTNLCTDGEIYNEYCYAKNEADSSGCFTKVARIKRTVEIEKDYKE